MDPKPVTQGAKMLLSFRHATHNVITFSYDFRGIPLTKPASVESLEDLNGVLQIGVQGFHALILADQQNLARLGLGGTDQNWETVDRAIKATCRSWMATAKEIIDFVSGLSSTDTLTELSSFLECFNEMKSIVAFENEETQKHEMPTWFCGLRDGAIQEFRDGQTLPLVSAE